MLTLAGVEMWERFSFYGMVSVFVLFLIAPPDGSTPPGPGGGLGEGDAAALFGMYSALVLAAPLLGGWVGDRLIGPRRAVVSGGLVIAAGHFVLLVPSLAWFWAGVLLIAAGTGLLKPNISTLLGQLYSSGDPRRDSGFSLFYLGINVGAFSAPLVCGWLAQAVSWRAAFAVAGVGMLAGLGQYAIGARRLGDAGRQVPRPADSRERRRAALLALVALAVVVVIFALTVAEYGPDPGAISAAVTVLVTITAVATLTLLLRRPAFTPGERAHLRFFTAMFVATVAFMAISSQVGSVLAEFTQSWVNREVGTFTVPPGWILSLNPLYVMALAPVFAVLWTRLGTRGPSAALKFALAIILVGASFLVMVPPGAAADGGASSSLAWILVSLLVLTVGELLLNPIALSATTALAPTGLAGQLLGLWYLAAAVGGAIGGQIARLLDVVGFAAYFALVGGAGVLAGLVYLALVPRLRALMAA